MKEVAWNKATQFEGPEQSPGFMLWQASSLWRRQIETKLATLKLTHPQFVLLANVGWLTRYGEITQAELARHCRMDINMTSQVLRTLEKKGYIERKMRQGDERSKFPRLSAKGASLVEKAVPLVEAVDRLFFSKLKRDEKKFLDILRKLAEA